MVVAHTVSTKPYHVLSTCAQREDKTWDFSATDGYTDGLFWSSDIESHLISPERVKSYSMTFHRAIEQIFKNLSAHFTSFPRLPGSKKKKKNDGCLSDHSQTHISF